MKPGLSIRAKCFLTALLPVSCLLLILAGGGPTAQTSPLVLSIGAGISLAISIAAGAVFSRNVCGRLERLVESAAVVATGIPIASLDSSRDELGRVAAAMVQMSRQVIEQKAEISETNVRLEAVLRASKDVSIMAEDLEGRIVLCNPGADQLLGYERSELLHRNLSEVVHPESEMLHRPGAATALKAARRNAQLNTPQEHENVYVRKDGLCLDVQLSVAPMRDMQGQLVGFLHVATDITHRKVLESELRQKNQQLKTLAEERGASSAKAVQILQSLTRTAVPPLESVHRSLSSLRETSDNEGAIK